MKCPNCGRTNGKTNKYCRECGTRLDVLAPAHDSAEPRADEVGLGEELFSVIELFESGDIDAALGKGVKLAEANPGSASAHSIVALVYERKAEEELAAGDPDGSRAFLKLAIDHYEEIIDLNPDSSADREKLASLRMKYTGHEALAEPKPAGFRIGKALQTVPIPVWAGIATFVVVLSVFAMWTRPTETAPQPTAKMAKSANKPIVNVTQDTGPALSVFTYPQASNAAPAPEQSMPIPRVSVPAAALPAAEVKPAHLPKIDQELTLVAEPKASPKKVDSAKSADNTSEKQPAPGPTAGSLLAQAIRLHDQGKTSEAIGVANQAIVLYKADVDADKNVDTARRGIANASKLISVWQESASNSE